MRNSCLLCCECIERCVVWCLCWQETVFQHDAKKNSTSNMVDKTQSATSSSSLAHHHHQRVGGGGGGTGDVGTSDADTSCDETAAWRVKNNNLNTDLEQSSTTTANCLNNNQPTRRRPRANVQHAFPLTTELWPDPLDPSHLTLILLVGSFDL